MKINDSFLNLNLSLNLFMLYRVDMKKMNAPMAITEKILAAHAGKKRVSPGELLWGIL
jgi:hypothetical protein